MKRTVWIFLVVCAVGLSIFLSTANLFLGDLNQDEGWYLYAAKQVTEGRMLYRDFMFTQGPGLPVVYGALFPVVEKLGVAGGRLITTLFGLGAAGCAAWLAARVCSRHPASPKPTGEGGWKLAAFAAFVLVGVNVYQSYFTTIVKTYALCAFFLTAGFVALSYVNRKRGLLAAFLGGVLLALAACTRLSAGVALPIAGIWLICNRKKVYPYGEEGAGFRFLPAWVAFGVGGGLLLLIGLVIFFVIAPENAHFALLGYHAGRSPGGLVELAALKVGFVSRFVQAYFVFAAGSVGAVLFHRHVHSSREEGGEEWNVRPRLTELLRRGNQAESPFGHSLVSLLWIVGGGVTLVHFTAPFPYDDYQVIAYPVLCAALAGSIVPLISERAVLRSAWVVLLVCAAASFSSPINQSWMVRGRDRIWWKFKETPDLALLQKVGREIRDTLGEDGLLLTQDTYLAIEAGARVPHGMEMGPFCYYPDMPREQAEQFNLLNEAMMVEVLRAGRAPMAAFSGYGLTIASPEIAEISFEQWKRLRDVLDEMYVLGDTVPDFGQAHTTLELFERAPVQ